MSSYRLLFGLGLVCLFCIGLGDNAALTTGGQPKMMSSHKSIEMQSEVVDLTVHWNRVDTTCSFVFVNDGAACKVRMGFPDFGMWAYAEPAKKPTTMFTRFQSYVDGKPVPTKLELGAEPGEQWQVKTVAFAKDGKRVVREVYSTAVGGVSISQTEAWGVASYLVHTGASWKGNIGKATIRVTFAPDSQVATPLDLLNGDFEKTKPDVISAQVAKPGGVAATGPCQPTMSGRTLTFERSNWRPSLKDDIYVVFKYPPMAMKHSLNELHKHAGGGGG